MNTATIIITETTDQLQVEVKYDPWPVKGGPINYAAIAATKMLKLFHEVQPEGALASQTTYNANTGETFTENNPPSK